MTATGALLALGWIAAAGQDGPGTPDGTQVKLFIRAENKNNEANVLKRHLADTESMTLRLGLGSVITRAQIEETLRPLGPGR